jgi:hypothetical protein
MQERAKPKKNVVSLHGLKRKERDIKNWMD